MVKTWGVFSLWAKLLNLLTRLGCQNILWGAITDRAYVVILLAKLGNDIILFEKLSV